MPGPWVIVGPGLTRAYHVAGSERGQFADITTCTGLATPANDVGQFWALIQRVDKPVPS